VVQSQCSSGTVQWYSQSQCSSGKPYSAVVQCSGTVVQSQCSKALVVQCSGTVQWYSQCSVVRLTVSQCSKALVVQCSGAVRPE
jgi:hypothetical protein